VISADPPWLESRPAELAERQDAPAQAEVAVIGGGLAGLAAALFLAEAGVAVTLLEAAGSLAAGFSGRASGLVPVGLGEHPGRLVDAVGLDAARQMHAFLRDGRQLLVTRGALGEGGLLTVCAMPEEEAEVRAAPAVLERLGEQALAWSAEEVAARLHGAGLGLGYLAPEGGAVAPLALAADLARAARAAGARLCVDQGVRSLDEGPGGTVLRGPRLELQADAVILAGGHDMAALVPWLAPILSPVRHQWIATAPVAAGRLPWPILGQHTLSSWQQLPAGQGAGRTGAGRIVAGGARYAAADMAFGQDDATRLDPAMDRVLRANLARFFPDLATVPVTHAWAAIATHACDGLPVIGPLPGRATLVCCTAFQGWDHALALRAGQAVAHGLLSGKAPGVPALFSPHRMVL